MTDGFFDAMMEKARAYAVDYGSNVVPWIRRCRGAGGTPTFRTRYAEQRFDGFVLGVCTGEDRPEVEGIWFRNVPAGDIERMEAGTGDWRWVLEKYGEMNMDRKLMLCIETGRTPEGKLMYECEEVGEKQPMGAAEMLERERMRRLYPTGEMTPEEAKRERERWQRLFPGEEEARELIWRRYLEDIEAEHKVEG